MKRSNPIKTKGGKMEKTIRAKFKGGIIEPLEKLEIEEDKEVLITIKELPSEDRFVKAAGGWKGTIDCEKLIEDIYKDRLLKTRSEVKL